MKIKTSSAIVLAIAPATPAMAHAGEHHGMSLSQIVAHLVSSPLHIAIFAGALTAFGYLVRLALKREGSVLRARRPRRD